MSVLERLGIDSRLLEGIALVTLVTGQVIALPLAGAALLFPASGGREYLFAFLAPIAALFVSVMIFPLILLPAAMIFGLVWARMRPLSASDAAAARRVAPISALVSALIGVALLFVLLWLRSGVRRQHVPRTPGGEIGFPLDLLAIIIGLPCVTAAVAWAVALLLWRNSATAAVSRPAREV